MFVKPFEKGRYDWSADQLALHALQRTMTMRVRRMGTRGADARIIRENVS